MPLHSQFAFFAIVSLFSLGSCNTRSHAPSELNGAVSFIQDYADSFKGLGMEAAKGRLANAQLKEESWASGKFGGRKLVAKFPNYELSVLFSDNKVVTASFQILSK